ncbi:MAG: hypothetical protein IT374_12080 [Polyangiaceae bacterium]|nr:hypothetical protein [Polyangiaceae bacterium]
MSRRRWYSGLVVISKTSTRTLGALRDHRLGAFIPFVMYLLIGSALLWVINTVAPLAPFVYSLF